MGIDVAVNLFARANEAVAGPRNPFAKSLLLMRSMVRETVGRRTWLLSNPF
ncbi:hypothetical protein RBSWK_04002 [Rhodopirellula baltica SWK14]|uniref:Uncharacterized protein n=1 Tax=Rhodopirellula baltica SWK14 TaxID=993516 RepID=L7CDJ8_RHOBT|nr:hypothetical protein RBSWK_04002 [Rhodopirellula baltica SWK14]